MKEKRRTQWGGYGKQYGTEEERKGNQTYRTDGTQTQGCNTANELQRQGNYFPTRSIGNGQGGNGGDEDRNIEILELVLRMIAMKRVIQKILMNWR